LHVTFALAVLANPPINLPGAVASYAEVVSLFGIIVTNINAMLTDAYAVDEADDPCPAVLPAVLRQFLRRPLVFVHRSKISSIISRS
jgi:hypothetical protein